MSPQPLRLEHLRADHETSGFACGIPELDVWLVRHALTAQQMDSASTFVATRDRHVAGYVSLTMGALQRAQAPARLVRGMPGYPVGMVLIARLAVDEPEQHAGLGTRLLADAVRLAALAGETAAARLIAVDAIDERAASFYRKHGFTETLDQPRRLYRRMKDVRASLQTTPHQPR